ncbi:GNAT family N-acetyltransferase [Gordonia sp. TBRC 11910]|uniref:GNAT family N-acetyltransferase n=1 Tax=Gordonia asplenii TaxID=2725283 RepID=A0A848KY15_9ACTN|nr:GNAT family N-acetyltransferase [Gordonia asplenii]NMO01745.1 GNAT family N-acetyltransferase [Gordonia asplenii]
MTAPVVVRPVSPADESDWKRLFTAYREFYKLTPDDAVVERVWSWIVDADQETNALLAETGGVVVGIADYREFARPSTGSVGLWLDDLFTDPTVRGRGIGRTLITELQRIAASRGLSVVRWITAADNATAQRLYDDVAVKTQWVTYDAQPRA